VKSYVGCKILCFHGSHTILSCALTMDLDMDSKCCGVYLDGFGDSFGGTESNTLNGGDRSIDDFDKLIQHEEFQKILNLAAKIKAVRLKLNGAYHPSFGEIDNDCPKITKIVRKTLTGKQNDVIVRGAYPVTDSLVDDTMVALETELERCIELSKQPIKKRKGKLEPIAVKYSKRQTDILTDWMIEHRHHPFPTAKEIEQLCKATDLSYSQVVNWTTNVRKRNLKATIEGKKPHHFLDFLFLAEHRDKSGEDTKLGNTGKGKPRAAKKRPAPKTPEKPKRARTSRSSKRIALQSKKSSVPFPTIPQINAVSPPYPHYTPPPFGFNASMSPAPGSVPFGCNIVTPLPPPLQIFRFPGSHHFAAPWPTPIQHAVPPPPSNVSGSDNEMKDMELEETVGKGPSTKLNMDWGLDESTLMKEDIISPRGEKATVWVVDALLEPSSGDPLKMCFVEKVRSSFEEADGSKRPSLTLEHIDSAVQTQGMGSENLEDLLNSPMEEVDESRFIVDV